MFQNIKRQYKKTDKKGKIAEETKLKMKLLLSNVCVYCYVCERLYV